MTSSRSRLISGVFGLVLLVIAALAYQTARQAQDAILESQSGSISEASSDPTAPGFRAFTEPTPVALVLHTAVSPVAGQGANLVGASVLIASGSDQGGTVISVPSSAQRSGEPSLEELFDQAGIDAVIDELKAILTIGFAEVVSLDAASWTTLMAPELPLDLTLREDLVDPTGQTLVGASLGPFALIDVAVIAGHRNPDEEALSVALRQQEIWKSWISRSASSGQSELPLVEQGFVEIIKALASGPVNYRIVPIRATLGSGLDSAYVLDEELIAVEISQLVPFPDSATPGSRPSLLLLDGTAGAADRNTLTSAVVLAGGRIAVLGNADDTIATSRIEVHVADALGLATALSEQLGGFEVVEVPLEDSTVDLSFFVGEDLAVAEVGEVSANAAE